MRDRELQQPMNRPDSSGHPDRRTALTGLVGVGATAAAVGTLLADDRAPAAPAADGGELPVLPADADWSSALAATPQVQLMPGGTYTLDSTVELPDNCLIVGNGATVTVSADSVAALAVTAKNNVTLTGIHFLGRSADPIGTPMKAAHVAVTIARSVNVRITGCDFTNWRGAGVVVTGDAADDYYAYRIKIQSNGFDRCFFGVSTADRGEYSLIGDNSFTYCRLALWNSAGNWTINGNLAVGCYGVYYSFARTSPYGRQPDDNWNHGSLVGNTFNHANGGTDVRWDTNAAFPLGGSSLDPGPGVIVDGVLPPTFSGNTLWYTDVKAADLRGTGWMLFGSTLSNLSISCTGDVPVQLVGVQAAKAPTLSGNVKNLLAA